MFPIMDALGSLRGVVNPTGEVLEGQDYAPYGTPFEQTGTAQTAFGFTGEITDPNGLLNLRARYYVPALGVFPSLDPVEEGNRYGYVGGDVVNRVDPSGMFNWLAFTIEEQDSLECIAVEGGASNYFQVKAFSDEVKRINLLQSISSPFGDSPIDYQGYLHPGRHLSIPNQLGDNFALMAMRNIHAIGRSGRIKKCPKHVRPPVIPPPAPTNGLGFIEGLSFGSGLGVAAIIGYDVVYNLVTFQRMTFDYSGVGISLNAGFSITPYFGYVLGLSNDAEGPQSFKQFSEDYAGKFEYFTGSASFPLPRLNLGVGASVTSFRSPDFRIQGTLYGATAGVSISPLELGFGTTKSEGRDRVSYVHSCIVDIQTLKADILGGSGFVSHTARSIAAETAEALAAHHNRNCSCATNLNGLIPLLSEDPRNSGFQEWQGR